MDHRADLTLLFPLFGDSQKFFYRKPPSQAAFFVQKINFSNGCEDLFSGGQEKLDRHGGNSAIFFAFWRYSSGFVESFFSGSQIFWLLSIINFYHFKLKSKILQV